jgi:HD-like signal output (HDOD) protein
MRVNAAVARGVEPRRAEQLLFGEDHCVWGERVAEDWGLAPDLVDAIRNHHDGRSSPLAAAVAAAREAAEVLGIGDGVVRRTPQLMDESSHAFEALRRLGGVNGLFERIDWYRGAIDPAA